MAVSSILAIAIMAFLCPLRFFTIVTTNLAFSEWTQLFENTTMVAALVDRLTYRSHVLDMSGPSYRLLTAQAENEAATAASTAG